MPALNRIVPGAAALGLALLLSLAATVEPARAAIDWIAVPEDVRADLEPRDGTRFDTVLARPDTDFSAYDAVYLEPVRIQFENERKQRRLTGSDERFLAGELGRALARRDGLAVEDPGPGVLIIEAVITDALPNRDRLGLRETGTLPGRLANPGTLVIGVGGATFEAVLTDAASGETVAVIRDVYLAPSMADNLNIHTRWGDTRDAFRRWARGFADLID